MTREEAIRCLSVYSSTNGSGLCTDKQHYEAKQMAIKVLEQTTWIPVSERLPEDSNYYFCCDKDGYMIIGRISKWSKEWCFDDDEVDMDVVAWMPLPQPYKAESEEE